MTYYVSVDFDRPLAIRRHVKRLSDFRAKAGETYCVSRHRKLGLFPSFDVYRGNDDGRLVKTGDVRTLVTIGWE
jgi:hypothetical protein